ncbi:ATPase vacuolar ER assembly factor Vma12 protein [Dioscorea alata]|uniref:ATPase vacuolar ER assembly factor Vma12 protein n=2 Tax=Dioscorea alata TaxID=55571 RepID=A0ACB7WIB0_DIOAL|nr:ATPase vacuolar ER assembly factor Vma12 protein [Dioscorea alata]KAH7687436.1 ATPase vacuolar ER assembly factor Vma12 protein [Dioscorea alata]
MPGDRTREGGVDGGDDGGLVVANNETLRSFLRSAADDHDYLTPELRRLASDLCSQSSIPYRSLRTVWFALPSVDRPALRRLFAGAEFVFSSPKPREKSEELKERLRKLEELAERKAYAELVKDIAPKKENVEPFSSYKDQIGFGMHVVLMMFTGYLVGYAAFRALFNHSAVMNVAGGILGLVSGMLLETVLFIIRTSNRSIASSMSTSKLKKNQ